jgi:hypothetical protein
MRTTPYTITDLLKQIRLNLYVIPQFQRNFVWKDSQVKLLVDSIARNYPLGSLLTMTKNSEVTLQSRSIAATIEFEEDDSDSTAIEIREDKIGTQYVLDGQQRLTSIARVFLNAHPKKNYYFDLKLMHDEFHLDQDKNWIISRKRGADDPERKANGRFLRADIALDSDKTDVYVSEYFEDSKDFAFPDRTTKLQAAAKIKKVFETIRNYSVPVVVLDRDAKLEAICRVFETINSTGTRLTVFDLAVAKFFTKIDLKHLWEVSQNAHPVLKEFDVDGERVLQVLALWNAKQNGKFPEAKRSVLLELDAEFLKNNWDEAAQQLANTYQWAKHNGATPKNLSNQGILVSIAAFRIVCAEFLTKPLTTFDNVLKRWYFSKIMRSTIGATTNYAIGQDFQSLVSYIEKNQPLTFETINLTKEKLLDLKSPQDSLYKAIQCVIRMSAKHDMWTGKNLDDSAVEDHHIFPVSLKNSGISKARLDCIANKLYVSTQTNRSLSNKKPEEYFADLQKQVTADGTQGDVRRRLQECFIPYSIEENDFSEKFKLENFEKFLHDRAELILGRIQEILGDSLVSDALEQDASEESDE